MFCRNYKPEFVWFSLSDSCDLTLDRNTVQNHLVLSDGNKMVTRGSTWQQYPDNPERFKLKTQVLCREGLSRHHYWEVEWDKLIYAAAAYKSIERKGDRSDSGFGNNTHSWAFGIWGKDENNVLSARHNGKVGEFYFPSDGCATLGVFLDWPAGTLSFYKVYCDTLTHLYTFRTTFTDPVYPGFWVYDTGNYVYLRPL
ncbi:LOW QUALITY PROTEIN: stonustoxin subunit alpha-like [Spinachia spinachia]